MIRMTSRQYLHAMILNGKGSPPIPGFLMTVQGLADLFAEIDATKKEEDDGEAGEPLPSKEDMIADEIADARREARFGKGL